MQAFNAEIVASVAKGEFDFNHLRNLYRVSLLQSGNEIFKHVLTPVHHLHPLTHKAMEPAIHSKVRAASGKKKIKIIGESKLSPLSPVLFSNFTKVNMPEMDINAWSYALARLPRNITTVHRWVSKRQRRTVSTRDVKLHFRKIRSIYLF
jgi:hypothetical protein